jgi:hypothetical protein
MGGIETRNRKLNGLVRFHGSLGMGDAGMDLPGGGNSFLLSALKRELALCPPACIVILKWDVAH